MGPAGPVVAQLGSVVTVELTAARRTIIEANQGQELTYVINTVVAPGADIGGGVIENEITQFTQINAETFDFTTPPSRQPTGAPC